MNETTGIAQTENSVSLIAKDISYIQKDLSDIKSSIKELAGVYATKIFVDEGMKLTNSRLDRLEKSSNLWRWLSPSLAAILASVMTFLVISYLTNIR